MKEIDKIEPYILQYHKLFNVVSSGNDIGKIPFVITLDRKRYLINSFYMT